MAIEAPLSKYKKGNIKLYAIACFLVAIVFGYDGYLSKYDWAHRQSFYNKHPDGKPDGTIVFNQKAAPILFGAGIVLAAYFWAIKDRKIVADESELRISGEEEAIPYSSIEAIDKTNFAAKGLFIISYKDSSGKMATKRLSDRNYDNLAAILDHLVAKIS